MSGRISRRDRGSPTWNGNDRLSSFYKQRFGSISPVEYMNIRILNIDGHLSKETVRGILDDELKTLGKCEIKVMNGQNGDRLVYVNFEDKNSARTVRKRHFSRLQRLLGQNIVIDPAGVVRDNDGKVTADRFYRNKSPVMQWNLKEGNDDISRTLFVGNLPVDITERELRCVFEKHGKVDDIDVKRPIDTNAAYAFIMFQSMESSRSAKETEHNTPVRPSTRRCKIGYGKSQASRRLWIGGLGPWATEDLITKEFDRYGMIDSVEYEPGSEFAYVRYSEQDAASEACKGMNKFALGGRHHEILVDYAKDTHLTRDRSRSSERNIKKRRASRSLSIERSLDGESITQEIFTEEQMDSQMACTWIGEILLKKTVYPIRLFRIYGSERLLQNELRDDDGVPHPISISQRVSVVGQESLEARIDAAPRVRKCLMLGAAKKNGGDISNLVKYFNQKQAAGLITLSHSSLYIVPHCALSTRLVSVNSPFIRHFNQQSNILLFVILSS